MIVTVAKNAGFCNGVRSAVDYAMAQGDGSFTYGDIVNNSKVVNELEVKGIKSVNDITEIPEGSNVVIRAHGIPKKDYEELWEKHVKIIDGTCPNVARVQRMVRQHFLEGYKIVLLGDKITHPETIGNNGWCDNQAIIIENKQEITNDILSKIKKNDKICAIACTTVSQEKWDELHDFLSSIYNSVRFINTICPATKLAQDEARELAKNSDAMIVIGDLKSSNSNKLNDICKERCANTQFVNDVNEINFDDLRKSEKVGIVAGMSTMNSLINLICDEFKVRFSAKIIGDKNGKSISGVGEKRTNKIM